ncbi:hypothetical protein HK097_005903 [Rhizophlyctis rosea]|uniref:2'-phosphotransferase n=1 Tax=Rhizophlyctis rosea TaxID=64517 RepID=A0AAD5X310_9FUNG|nr:hypothetical protein HK097_005903 [Rhizophlyctis rosea]
MSAPTKRISRPSSSSISPSTQSLAQSSSSNIRLGSDRSAQYIPPSANSQPSRAAEPNQERGQDKGGRGGKSARPPQTPEEKASRALSYLLRHAAEKEGIPMRPDGYALVDDVLRHNRLKGITLETLIHIVDTNDKKRYTLKTEQVTIEVNGEAVTKDVYYIRANQGHSITTVEVEMQEITSPSDAPIVVHGTYRKFWPSIAREGLKAMSRQHIHFASGKFGEEGVTSGMRKNCDLFIYVDLTKALDDGIKFLRSANGVILSAGNDGVLSPKYFLKVEDNKGNAVSSS